MASQHYDAAVVGMEPGALVAAALLARRGLRVLVLGNGSPPATLEVGATTLPAAPAPLPPPQLEPALKVFTELNDGPVVRRRAPPIVPALRVSVGPSPRRVTLGPDASAVANELRREFPGEHAELAAVLARLGAVGATLDPILASSVPLPPAGFWDRREVARTDAQLPKGAVDLLSPLAADHPMRAALVAIGALSGRFAPTDVGPVPLARAFELARRGLHLLEGGAPALRRLFAARIEASSGELRTDTEVTGLELRRGRVTSLRLGPREDEVGVGQVIWAQPLARLVPLLDERAGRRVRELRSALRPACHRYRLCVTLRASGVPAGLGPRLVSVRDPARPPIDGNALLVTTEPLGAERVMLWAEALVPAAAVDPALTYLTVVRQRVLEHVAELVPNFEEQRLVAISAHDGIAAEGPEGRGADGRPVVLRARPMEPLWSSDLPRVLDVGAAPLDLGPPNLHLASTESLPGLGVEADFVTGWSVARRVQPAPRVVKRRRVVLVGS
jgi:hypothetical protein